MRGRARRGQGHGRGSTAHAHPIPSRPQPGRSRVAPRGIPWPRRPGTGSLRGERPSALPCPARPRPRGGPRPAPPWLPAGCLRAAGVGWGCRGWFSVPFLSPCSRGAHHAASTSASQPFSLTSVTFQQRRHPHPAARRGLIYPPTDGPRDANGPANAAEGPRVERPSGGAAAQAFHVSAGRPDSAACVIPRGRPGI